MPVITADTHETIKQKIRQRADIPTDIRDALIKILDTHKPNPYNKGISYGCDFCNGDYPNEVDFPCVTYIRIAETVGYVDLYQ